VTRSPANTRIRLRLNFPARWARTVRSWSNWTLNSPLGNFSTTVPVTSILSSLLIRPQKLVYELAQPRKTGIRYRKVYRALMHIVENFGRLFYP